MTDPAGTTNWLFFVRGRMRFDEIGRQDASEVRTADAIHHLADVASSASISERARVSGGNANFYRRRGKRVFDLILVITFSPAWMTLIALLALLVRRDGGPAFYTQERIGMGGRVFKMWKLRSMVVGADELLAAHLADDPAARAEWAEKQKLSRDPRITKFGKLIRKTSLDEMPQLWNVLIGDMSLVGPRPMMVDQRTLYLGTAYEALRPGITGPWQVTERHESSFSRREYFDQKYLTDVSLAADVKILMETVSVVAKCRGI